MKRYKKSVIFLVLLIVFLSIWGMSRCNATTSLRSKSDPESDSEVYITRTGSKYHLDECRYLRESKIPISLEDAKEQGYTPCKACDPPQ